MLRLVLLVLYFIASSSTSPQAKQGVALLGLRQPPPAANAGAGNDPDGRLHQPPPTTDAGAGYDPNG
ncbi:MAG TPA: hypothetical protein VGG20_01110 [Thermoanaerobaculia bacterium]|jgi:hypothetical protein